MKKSFQKLSMLCLALVASLTVQAADVTAKWTLADLCTATVQSSTTDYNATASDGSTIVMHVDASSGKVRNNSNSVQLANTTKLQVPVKFAGDSVYVQGYPGYQNYTVGGVAATISKTNGYVEGFKASSADAKQGYVEIVSTNNNCYIIAVEVKQFSKIKEKKIYATEFTDWEGCEKIIDNASDTTFTRGIKTQYSNENITFTLMNTNVYTGVVAKKNTITTGGLCAMKRKETGATITSTEFASVTKVAYFHTATGSSRGWGLKVKGTQDDGTQDEDWVTVYETTTNSNGSDVLVDVNRTNVQLQFYNLNPTNYAIMDNLTIYGNVDFSSIPVIDSFSANGTKYVAADICEDKNGENIATIELPKAETMVSKSNPLTDITLENGELTSTSYETTGDTCTVKMVATLGDKTANYTITFVPLCDYTVSYYDVDGTTLIGKQTVEKKSAIGTYAYGASNVTVADGKAFRGWFKRPTAFVKIPASTVVMSDLSLYARATDIEDGTGCYTYNFTDVNFDAADHECLDMQTAASSGWHDATHGWVFAANDVVTLKVGGDARIIVTGCKYTKSDISVSGPDSFTSTIAADTQSDGTVSVINYSGAAGDITLTMSGVTYLHNITVINTSAGLVTESNGYHVVKAGDVNSLYGAIALASSTNTAENAETFKIFVPNGTYDMGETVLTQISGYNISIIGESMENTIIVNAPAAENEGIGTTATLYNTSKNLYMQDLTLKNALDYYGIGGTGRAVCLWDKGNNTICKNVKMLSYQDTYYSNNDNGQFYWEDSEIHGTVDFICGGGDIVFESTKLVVEKRNADGKGSCTITAPTTATDYGYVFDNCTIDNQAESYNLGRSWQNSPRTVFLHTTMNAEPNPRWTLAGMNGIDPKLFAEYDSKLTDGTDVTPAQGTTTTFKNKSTTITTVLTDEEAAKYTVANIFGSWAPDAIAKQVTEMPTEESIFLVNGEITTVAPTSGKVRVANARGGFGPEIDATTTAIETLPAEAAKSAVLYNIAGQKVNADYNGIVISNGKKFMNK